MARCSPPRRRRARRLPRCARNRADRSATCRSCRAPLARPRYAGCSACPGQPRPETLVLARYQLVDLAMELRARELARLDHPFELALQHVKIPTVDDDLVHLRPAGRIEF